MQMLGSASDALSYVESRDEWEKTILKARKNIRAFLSVQVTPSMSSQHGFDTITCKWLSPFLTLTYNCNKLVPKGESPRPSL